MLITIDINKKNKLCSNSFIDNKYNKRINKKFIVHLCLLTHALNFLFKIILFHFFSFVFVVFFKFFAVLTLFN